MEPSGCEPRLHLSVYILFRNTLRYEIFYFNIIQALTLFPAHNSIHRYFKYSFESSFYIRKLLIWNPLVATSVSTTLEMMRTTRRRAARRAPPAAATHSAHLTIDALALAWRQRTLATDGLTSDLCCRPLKHSIKTSFLQAHEIFLIFNVFKAAFLCSTLKRDDNIHDINRN